MQREHRFSRSNRIIDHNDDDHFLSLHGKDYDISNLLIRSSSARAVTSHSNKQYMKSTAERANSWPFASMNNKAIRKSPYNFSFDDLNFLYSDDKDNNFKLSNNHPPVNMNLERKDKYHETDSTVHESSKLDYSYSMKDTCMRTNFNYAYDETESETETENTNSSEEHTVEISPGVFIPYIHSNVTKAAVRHGRCLYVSCLECGSELICQDDVQYIICPDCRVVSPTSFIPENVDEKGHYQHRRSSASIGLKSEWCSQENTYI